MSDKDLRVWVEDQLYALLGKLLPLPLSACLGTCRPARFATYVV